MFVCVKQKTAYEMRISDWSSDVCASDLAGLADDDHRVGEAGGDEVGAEIVRICLEGDEQVEAARRGRGGYAAEQREIKGVDRAAILAGAANGDERDRLAAFEAERRRVAVDDIAQFARGDRDARARFGVDAGAVARGARDGRLRPAGALGDVERWWTQ